MLRAWVLVVALMGCGRFGFDTSSAPVDDAPPDTPPDAPAIPGLLAAFSFDDDPNDGVENHTTGTPPAVCHTTCPTLVPGIRGSAYKFNGTTDAIRYGNAAAFHTQAGTVAAWVRFDATPALDQYMVLAGKPFGAGVENSWEVFLYQDVSTLDSPAAATRS